MKFELSPRSKELLDKLDGLALEFREAAYPDVCAALLVVAMTVSKGRTDKLRDVLVPLINNLAKGGA